MLPALLLALFLHGLLLSAKLPFPDNLPPHVTGGKSIAIRLDPFVSVKKKPETVKEETAEALKPVPEPSVKDNGKDHQPMVLKRQAVKKISHPPSSGKVTRTDPHNTANPVQEIIDSAVPVSVKASPLSASNPKPEYPAFARRRNQQGTVMVSVSVSEKGHPDRVRLHKSSGYPLLDKSALKTVALWHFLPGTTAGLPVSTEVLIPIRFKLD